MPASRKREVLNAPQLYEVRFRNLTGPGARHLAKWLGGKVYRQASTIRRQAQSPALPKRSRTKGGKR